MAAGPAADGLGRLLVRGAGPAAGQRGGHGRHGHDRLGSGRVVPIRGPVRRHRQLHRYLRQRRPAGDLVGRYLDRWYQRYRAWWSGWEEPDLDADRVGDAGQVARVAGDDGGLVADGGHDDDRVEDVGGPGGGAGDASDTAGGAASGK